MEKTVGILGGGQLGRMLTEAANNLNIKVITLDAANSPAKQVNGSVKHILGNFKTPSAIKELAKKVDVLTVEIEHVDTHTLEDLEAGDELASDWRRARVPKVDVQPHWETIRIIQDKFDQKEFLIKRDIPTARSVAVAETGNEDDATKAIQEIGNYPVMLKARKEAYDGRGNFVVKSESQISEAIKALGGRNLYIEEWADFQMELAVMVVKTKEQDSASWEQCTLAFPVVETIHEDSICKLVYSPPRNVSKDIQLQAQEFARKAVAGFRGKGIFGVEMFLLKDGRWS
jgi:phosphoribosylaminoimidazole carboxylase